MELLLDKVWGIISVVLTALLGFFMYVIKKYDSRLTTIENEFHASKTEIATAKVLLYELKEDVLEIKQMLKTDNEELKKVLLKLAGRRKI